MKNQPKILLVFASLLCLLAFSSCSNHSDSKQEESTSMTSNEQEEEKNGEEYHNDHATAAQDQNPDTKFVEAAADGGMLEVELGKLAQEKAHEKSVKNFGQQMEKDHGKANQKLKELAQTKGITVPESLSEKSQKTYDKLAGLSGEEFDKAYVDLMLSDHKEDIKAFEKEADKGEDADIKAFASNTLPTLRHHLSMIEDIHNK